MFPSIRALFFLACLLAMTGCELSRVLVIKPDGSGEIHEKLIGPREGFIGEKRAAAKEGEDQPMNVLVGRPSIATVQKNAAEFGEGVEVISYKKLETKDTLGYEAVYRFPDVTKIRSNRFVSQHGAPGEGDPEPDGDGVPVNFEFTKGPVSELRVPLKPLRGESEKESAAPEAQVNDPKEREASIEAIKHLNLRFSIRVEGAIEKTNSHFRDGNEVVVSELNFKGMAADPKHAQAFADAAAGKISPDEPPPDERYFKDESVNVLTIRFRPAP